MADSVEAPVRNQAGNHPLFTVLAATMIVIACIGAYVWVNNHGPVHAGQVISVSAYPIHRELSTGSGLGGVNGGPNVFDEVIVIANVKIRSQTKLPLFLHDMWAEVTLASGDVHQSLAASGADDKKVFVAYPTLASQQKTPMPRDITLTPGQEIEGQMIFHFPITEKDWDARKQFDVVVGFIHQKDLVLHTMPVQTQN
ncbi:MAG TPA: hypothetical protein VHZ25_04905 [Acidobacteriaceae bacterium]|jgi:hypothetical protein|nr:hypothetical protein [Acidobacteriaceae bacterium]